MKITIAETTEKEMEFPTPSYWGRFGTFYMVTDERMVIVHQESVFVNSDIEDKYFKNKVVDLSDRNAVQISEEDFFEQFEKTIQIINEAVKVPV